ncbi:MAG: abc-f [Anaerocolumna sp.]|jgi:ATPase subunit of ABC transporter with duplicated ATPase domains|nr:abc-f [Anaerocolumna sp.]
MGQPISHPATGINFMLELSVNNLVKYYGANKIFENISFEIKTGERIGLIGQNGCGKTTIMKIIMSQEDYQGGDITYRKDIKIGYLNQIPTYDDNTKALDVIRSAFLEVFQIKNRMKELEKQLEYLMDSELEKAILFYGKLTEEYERKGGYHTEIKVNKITEGLKINDQKKEMFFNQLSGGEKTRVILAKILLEEPDILLLDEPTNHLDFITITWLEGFLKEYKGSVLIISHDRYFLDKVVNRIVELEFSKTNEYLGNYSYYVVEKERRFLIDLRNYQNQQKKIEQMERQIERYRIWGEMRDSDKMFKKAKELEKRLEKMDVLDKPAFENRKVRFGNNSIHRTGKIVFDLEHVKKSFTDKALLQDINFTIYYQDSACIIGQNGGGKSTLLKLIVGELEPEEGIVKIGSQVKIGYLPQHVIYENEEQTLVEYFSALHNITYETARSQLARALFFKEDVNKKIKFLSGGEKSRLRLCSLTFEGVNVMILDEPTNHLDIDSREVLEETLSTFEGTLLFVSHDRYFINKIADKILAIENNRVKVYSGDFTDYLDEYAKTITSIEETAKLVTKTPIKSVEKESPASIQQRPVSLRKIEELEHTINDMEEQLKELQELIEEYNTDMIKLNALFQEKALLEKSLNLAYEKWEQMQLI